MTVGRGKTLALRNGKATPSVLGWPHKTGRQDWQGPNDEEAQKVAERGARKSRGPGPVYPEVALGKPALDGSDEVERLFCASAHR